jgi:sporulation protein YlmC with PRC-barrel domain
MSSAMQTIELVKVDVQTLSGGHRCSRIIGSSVVNENDDAIGKIDDLLVSSDAQQPFAVLSIGGFLGMGTHLVVVPYGSLKLVDNKVILPGGSKEGLRTLPTFTYATA